MAYLTILADDAERREFGMRDLEEVTSLHAGLREFFGKCPGRRRTQAGRGKALDHRGFAGVGIRLGTRGTWMKAEGRLRGLREVMISREALR